MNDPIEERARAEAERLRRLGGEVARTDSAWHELQSPAVPVVMPTEQAPRRPRALVWIPALAAAAGLLLTVVWAVGLSDHGDGHRVATEPASTVSTTSQPSTTQPATTLPATTQPGTTETPSISTTLAAVTAGWNPACQEHGPLPGSTTIATDDPSMATLGPLGAVPALHVTLPRWSAEASGKLEPSTVDVERVRGGLLLVIRGGDPILSVVNNDGTVRWVRCFTQQIEWFAVAAAALDPHSVLVGFVQAGKPGGFPASPPHDDDWRTFGLTDGVEGPRLTEYAKQSGAAVGRSLKGGYPAASSAATVVFGPPVSPAIRSSDVLVRVDLKNMAVSTLPVSPAMVGMSAIPAEWLELGTNGEVLSTEDSHLLCRPYPAFEVRAVYHHGSWVDAATHPALARAALPVVAGVEGSGPTCFPASLSGRDALLKQVWIRPDVFGTGAYGTMGTSGAVAVVSACTELSSQGDCVGPKLVAVDVATGVTKWSLPGLYAIGPVSDGKALVQPYTAFTSTGRCTGFASTCRNLPSPRPDGQWVMIDLATGNDIAGQKWPTASFDSGCCLEPDETVFLHTNATGGVVVAVNGVDVNVWFPKALSGPTIEVAIP